MKWLVKIIIEELVVRLINFLRDWWAKRKKAKAVKGGLDENDSGKVERAIGSDAAGVPSGLDGSKVRPRQNHD